MTRRVRQKGSQSNEKSKDIIESNSEISAAECCTSDSNCNVDWTTLPDDTMIQLFSSLNYRDRASLSSTCQTYRLLGSSACLWDSLDLRCHKFNSSVAEALSSRCKNLQKLRFRGVESANAIISLQARGLRGISGDFCQDMSDATLSMLAARHDLLENLQLGLDACQRISSDAIEAIAFCCKKLQRLQLSGVKKISGYAINTLAQHCPQLVEVEFVDCENVDVVALGNLSSVRYLSVAGARNLKWDSASQVWSKLPNLLGLDVSRTEINSAAAGRLFSLSQNLKVMLALNCPIFEAEVSNISAYNRKDRLLFALFNNIIEGLTLLSSDKTENKRELFSYWGKLKNKDKRLREIICWIERVLSHSLWHIAENSPRTFDDFWLKQGVSLSLCLLQSLQEDVQERATTTIATFLVDDDEIATVNRGRAEAVLQDGGILLLLDLARSCREALQSEAAKAIANLSMDPRVAKAVAENGGINVLVKLVMSMNKFVAEEAAGGLWNLSVGEEHKSTITEAGGVKALVDLIFRWPSDGDGSLCQEHAAGALANLSGNYKCSLAVAEAGGVHTLLMLAYSSKAEGVQEQAARALVNLASHGDSNTDDNSSVGQDAGALVALVQLTSSQHEGVRQEAAGALWNLSFDEKNREAIVAAGGVEALVALIQSCSNFSQGLQERAAGALWGLSVSEANSIAIGQEGGIAPLIALAHSDIEAVHETATGALWNLSFNPGNAVRIVEDGGVSVLVHLCSSSTSKMARYMAALALTYVFDGRMDEIVLVGSSSERNSKTLNLDGLRRLAFKHIEEFLHTFTDTQTFSTVVTSLSLTTLAHVAEATHIQEARHLRCSGAEIGRYIAMLQNSYSILKACAAFALFQLTMPRGRHAMHHTSLLQNGGVARVLRVTAAAANSTLETKVYAKLVLRNLELCHSDASISSICE
ncbi:protein ARABIDILLO 1 isoform X1 [Ziziphus jujuba]|uniref:Protein ARABIDILLO 1 isoform X1 n=1 Tax=Ziziphus jujuba TaxID=326968 RepID=A0A6P3ZQQ8_ZIZJJ|nr:protein ARABIDILLO 1 isoform X1 [Ziziphus jujuba]XP_048326358.2 protein ARABIDILLO 1 isoform X1 [Ziziphus jujuba]XP_048326360.2 protein ARABIDILLO 1 isoform X1 [Ziziphus jujuba]